LQDKHHHQVAQSIMAITELQDLFHGTHIRFKADAIKPQGILFMTPSHHNMAVLTSCHEVIGNRRRDCRKLTHKMSIQERRNPPEADQTPGKTIKLSMQVDSTLQHMPI
jgi:hypothetical protein